METIQSVRAQTFRDYEHLLVVDAASSDGSLVIALREAGIDDRIIVKHGGTQGVAANRNLALDSARGEFVAFLDADDLWTPEKLQIQLKFMRENGVRFSCTSFAPVSDSGKRQGAVRKPPSRALAADLLRNNTVGCLTVMIERALVGSSRFRESSHEDLLFWYELTKTGTEIFGIPETLAFYRIVAGSRSNNKWKAAVGRWNLYRKELRFSGAKSLIYFAHYAASGLVKRFLNVASQ